MTPTKEEFYKAQCARHGEELQKKLSETTVAVAGLGGLGSNISISLARLGIGKLILIDFDKVDVTNLHRQQYKACQVGMNKADALAENLHEINPYIELETHVEKITSDNAVSLLGGADIVCEAFDNAQNKAMLVETVLTKLDGIYIVSGSGMAGINSANDIVTKKISEKFFLCGDRTSDVATSKGLFAPRVMLCASHEALMVLRIIAGFKEV
ncbi:thiamine biosynthesis protein ThiF [Treponema sp.]|uniref:thiamine biosynthesis protein ThiF n=1 Tax=Treponema sp. TaxID=166 RepID=UPI00298E2C7F|nr:thiamine biosynthesis protein ThiF [Treponema sp.]MCR5613471.1 thiamine biosynthesis protein ThiF [Treponema sp.]